MSEPVETRAAVLRREFDATFAAPPAERSADVEDLLGLRIGGNPYAIRLRDTSGIMSNRPIVEVPTRRADVLGLTGVRGNIVPVFSLASLLGYAEVAESPKWLVLCEADDPLALAFAEFEGFRRVPASMMYADAGGRAVARGDDGARSVIDIAAIVAAIRGNVR